VLPDAEQLGLAASRMIAEHAVNAVVQRGRFSIALAGGNTPRRTYELLAAEPLRGQVPWSHVHVFWGDERCVPPDAERSNQRMARIALLDHVPIPPEQIHPIDCTGPPADAADSYEACLHNELGEHPRFDLVLLGLGENGHTASLFPYAAVLQERDRRVADVYVAEQNMHRITVTAPLINHARCVVFLVAGVSKAATVQQVLRGKHDPQRLPAQLIQPIEGELHWLLDAEAASRL
jgi:6-phosphogluconolactonase